MISFANKSWFYEKRTPSNQSDLRALWCETSRTPIPYLPYLEHICSLSTYISLTYMDLGYYRHAPSNLSLNALEHDWLVHLVLMCSLLYLYCATKQQKSICAARSLNSFSVNDWLSFLSSSIMGFFFPFSHPRKSAIETGRSTVYLHVGEGYFPALCIFRVNRFGVLVYSDVRWWLWASAGLKTAAMSSCCYGLFLVSYPIHGKGHAVRTWGTDLEASQGSLFWNRM